jgi:hypothetical protein
MKSEQSEQQKAVKIDRPDAPKPADPGMHARGVAAIAEQEAADKLRADQTQCPKCGKFGCPRVGAFNSRRGLIRYRKCTACQAKFSTIQRVNSAVEEVQV